MVFGVLIDPEEEQVPAPTHRPFAELLRRIEGRVHNVNTAIDRLKDRQEDLRRNVVALGVHAEKCFTDAIASVPPSKSQGELGTFEGETDHIFSCLIH